MASAPSTGMEAYLESEDSKKVGRGTVSKTLVELAAHPGPLMGGLALVVLGATAGLSEPRIFGYAIDEAILPGKLEQLSHLALFFLLAVCLRVGAVIGSAYLFEVLGQRVGQSLRLKLFSHLERLPVATFDRNPAGRLMTRVTNDVASVNEMFSAGVATIFSNVLTVIGILAWLLYLNPKLGLIASSILPLMFLASAHFSRKLGVAYREARSKLSALNAFLAENLLGMKVVHLFNRQARHLERFDRVNHWYTDAQISSIRIYALFQPTITLCSGIAVALVIWFGGRDVIDGRIQVGVLVAYFAYLLSLFQPLRELADKWNMFLSGMAAAERIFEILQWPVEMEPSEASRAAKPIPELKGRIQFENVWFAYDKEHWVLRDLSLDIPAGSRLGVVGHTGAGKTTLISLLMRFYEPQKGRILLDGRDLREYSKRDLRTSIGIIQQDAFLFSGTMKDNITFWKEGGLSGEVADALHAMGLGAEWQSRELQERGSNVSVGEKQALAFARAMASQPGIWILDEATANMDSRTEQVLQSRLEASSRGRTAIFIAHRLATVRSADQIIVLHRGSLVERGRHEDLVRMDGLYARLYRYQRAQQEARELGLETTEPG
jgi:ATP-binding cassette, subfamily B, multidrug efflux pump